ncbi:uncharacterized protein MONOS_15999 [Monocercomonoides exilis]|uniref:uncharacterized protein n=1 Tax=Monocercomonoides exilis TaxID=2049356 RepID=UPI0035593C93|nr:hypothetical protein MONOS_15999 [Monocercomonoides exilis]|eukprot:MONOS_15999.1-p1 / transcript=MONOS_15999.1 / gene=MONOS_15999 / organism=Monocercomonoides_exilis_PA203 / gene_product=unspecified product / transcript_product=unspecified product / location=Mono_scaffold01452:6436-8116(-) / protein_length=511 / sequence_SO=supercontig / SO=protein_coding / is_pseudo=false
MLEQEKIGNDDEKKEISDKANTAFSSESNKLVKEQTKNDSDEAFIQEQETVLSKLHPFEAAELRRSFLSIQELDEPNDDEKYYRSYSNGEETSTIEQRIYNKIGYDGVLQLMDELNTKVIFEKCSDKWISTELSKRNKEFNKEINSLISNSQHNIDEIFNSSFNNQSNSNKNILSQNICVEKGSKSGLLSESVSDKFDEKIDQRLNGEPTSQETQVFGSVASCNSSEHCQGSVQNYSKKAKEGIEQVYQKVRQYELESEDNYYDEEYGILASKLAQLELSIDPDARTHKYVSLSETLSRSSELGINDDHSQFSSSSFLSSSLYNPLLSSSSSANDLTDIFQSLLAQRSQRFHHPLSSIAAPEESIFSLLTSSFFQNDMMADSSMPVDDPLIGELSSSLMHTPLFPFMNIDDSPLNKEIEYKHKFTFNDGSKNVNGVITVVMRIDNGKKKYKIECPEGWKATEQGTDKNGQKVFKISSDEKGCRYVVLPSEIEEQMEAYRIIQINRFGILN